MLEIAGMTHPSLAFMPLAAPPLEVETAASPEQLAAMARHVAANWRRLGASEPHFSVIVDERYRRDRIADSEEAFYRSGAGYVEELRQTAARCGIDIGEFRCCLELGAGVGRVSVWLAEAFPRLVALDVSPPHLDLARAAAARFGRGNIDFVLLDDVARFSALGRFDVFASVITLQHNPPPLIALLLRTALARLAPGGIAFFQVPTYHRGYRFRVAEYLAAPPDGMEMHLIPQAALFRILSEAGCRVLACHDDFATGGYMVSNTILAQKQAAARRRWWRR
jgi:SAM-dependent methyltransferase